MLQGSPEVQASHEGADGHPHYKETTALMKRLDTASTEWIREPNAV